MLRYARKIKERPTYFRLNPAHPFTEGALGAYLGYGMGGGPFHDSSLNQNHGVYTKWSTTTPSQNWTRQIGRPALNFPNNDSECAVISSLNLGTVHSIVFWTTATSSAILGGTSSSNEIGKSLSNPYYVAGGTTVSFTGWTAPSGPTCVIFVRNGTSVSLYRNNTQVSTTQTLGSNTSLTLTTIGALNAGASGAISGRLFDVMFLNFVLTADEIQASSDPGNVMYEIGGVPWLLPMHRRGYVPATTTTFQPAWARNSYSFA